MTDLEAEIALLHHIGIVPYQLLPTMMKWSLVAVHIHSAHVDLIFLKV